MIQYERVIKGPNKTTKHNYYEENSLFTETVSFIMFREIYIQKVCGAKVALTLFTKYFRNLLRQGSVLVIFRDVPTSR